MYDSKWWTEAQACLASNVTIYWNNMLALRWASVANVIKKVCVWREQIDAGHYGCDDDNSAGRKPGAEPRIWSTDKKMKAFFMRSKEHETTLTASQLLLRLLYS